MNSCLCAWMASWSSSAHGAVLFDGRRILHDDSQLAVDLCHAVLCSVKARSGTITKPAPCWSCPSSAGIIPFRCAEMPLHRELGQSLQRCGLTMQVGDQPLAWPSLLIPVGLDKGS